MHIFPFLNGVGRRGGGQAARPQGRWARQATRRAALQESRQGKTAERVAKRGAERQDHQDGAQAASTLDISSVGAYAHVQRRMDFSVLNPSLPLVFDPLTSLHHANRGTAAPPLAQRTLSSSRTSLRSTRDRGATMDSWPGAQMVDSRFIHLAWLYYIILYYIIL